MSGPSSLQPKPLELQTTFLKFVDYLRIQNYLQPGKKLSVKTLRNVYNQQFKYAFTYVSSSLFTSLI